MADRIEHLVFGNSGGIRLIAGSMEDREQQGAVGRRLDGFVRLEEFQGQRPPPEALSSVQLDSDRIAVIHRVDDGSVATGRNRADVLVGPLGVLTPEVVLGLYRWPAWQMPVRQGPLPPVSADRLVAESQLAADRLEQSMRSYSAQISHLLAVLVDHPDDRIVVLGCPPDSAIPILWGLHRIADRPFARAERPQTWTFSTYESAGIEVQDAPRFVFLRGRPDHGTRRFEVDLSGAGPAVSDEALEWAEGSMSGYFGSSGRLELPPVTAAHDGALRTTVAAGSRGVPGALSHEYRGSRPSLRKGRGRAEPPSSAPTGGGAAGLPGGYRDSAPAAGDGHDDRSAQGLPATPSEIATRFRTVRTAGELSRVLASLTNPRDLRQRLPPKELVEVFEHLDGLRPGSREDHAVGLLNALFGREHEGLQTEPGLQYATTLVGLSAVEAADARRARPLVAELVSRMQALPPARSALGDAVLDPFLRSLGLAEVAPADAGARLTPPQRPGPDRRYPTLRWDRMLAIGAVLVVVLLAGAFLLGRSTAGVDAGPELPPQPLPPASAVPAPTTGPTTDTRPPPTPLPPVEPGPTGDPVAAPDPATVPRSAVGPGETVFTSLRDYGNNLFVGPECEPVSTGFRCLPATPPAGFQVATARPAAVPSERLEALRGRLLDGGGKEEGVRIFGP